MKVSRKRFLHAAVVLLSCSILAGASRCTDCGEGTYYSETTRKCEARIGAGVEIDSDTGVIVAQLSDEAVAALQTSVMQLQSRIETLETTSTAHGQDIAANSDAVLNLPDFSGWDTNASDDFDGSYTSLSNLPSLPPPSVSDLSNYLTVDTTNHSIVLSGVNLKVVDGTGSTACSGGCNGLGNVVVGYDEGSAANKSGSHNLVTGSDHTYLSYGGFLAGRNNSLEAEYCSASGGQGNVASAVGAAISGGVDNSATGDGASVSGGSLNSAISNYSWIGGGESNQVSADYGSISGGEGNIVYTSASYSSISGGKSNEMYALWGSISGGSENTSLGRFSWLAGGQSNTASAWYGVVVGGSSNEVGGGSSAQAASVFGGFANQADGSSSTVVGGRQNQASGQSATVAGGMGHVADEAYEVIP